MHTNKHGSGPNRSRAQSYYYLGCSIMAKEIGWLAPQVNSNLKLELLPATEHHRPQLLRQRLQAALDRLEKETSSYQAILIGYGLCGQTIAGLQARSIPLVVPRAHDCITLLLGSKERYQKYFRAHPGNYWYSAGWIEQLATAGAQQPDVLKSVSAGEADPAAAAFLRQALSDWPQNYQQATLITWPLAGSAAYRNYTKQAALSQGWKYRELKGDPRLLHDLLAGNWDPQRFLVVPPGQRVRASFDQQLITTQPPAESE